MTSGAGLIARGTNGMSGTGYEYPSSLTSFTAGSGMDFLVTIGAGFLVVVVTFLVVVVVGAFVGGKSVKIH